MRIVIATGNQGKVEEMRPEFEEEGHRLERIEVDIDEIDALDVEDVAEQKARDSLQAAYQKGADPEVLIVEDTGFYVEALKGFPGAKAAFFADSAGVGKLLKLLEDEEDRSAYFKTSIAAVSQGQVKVFSGKVKGSVPKQKRGEAHPYLPYDSYFVPKGNEKSFAEDPEYKKKVSQREKAVRKFLEWI